MRHLILTTAAILAIAGATSNPSFAKRHHHAAAAEAASAAAPADTMDAHAARAKNLRDAGYNPKNDMDANGNVRQN
jgi:hypothetical protein